MAGAVHGDGVAGVGAAAGVGVVVGVEAGVVAGMVAGAMGRVAGLAHMASPEDAASRMVRLAVSTVVRPEASTVEQLAVSMVAVDFMEVVGSTVVGAADAGNRQQDGKD
jgi:hypothetical protein